jgi:serine/threonine protein phosphatase PrpC
MTAVAEAPNQAKERKERRAEEDRESSTTDIDKTLGHWEKFLATQPGCDTGFVAAPGQAMRAINVSSAAQVPMILRELHQSDGTIRINFPESTEPKVTQDQVKIRAFLQGHHGKDLASLKDQLVALLEGSHSFKELKENAKFKKSFASAEQWINANFSGVESDSSSLDVTDVVSVKGAAEEREPHVTGVIASLHEAVTAGRGAVVTISHEDARDDGLRGVIREKLAEIPAFDTSKIAIWVGADVGSPTKELPDCQGVRTMSLAEFLSSTEISRTNDTPAVNDDLVLGGSSATTRSPETTVAPEPSDSLGELQIGSASTKEAAAPTQSNELQAGVAVDNHRKKEGTLAPQEDRHLVRSFPTIDPEQAMEYLRHTVKAMDEVTKNNDAGSTFTGVIVTKDGNFVTAHLGDSPASAVIIGKDGNLKKVVTLIQDHKPVVGSGTSPTGIPYDDLLDSRNDVIYRVINNNDPERKAGVAMTRALGNAHFGDVLSHEPELHVHEIQKSLQEGERLFLLVTSDGAHNENIGVTHEGHGLTIAEELRRGSSLADISKTIASKSADIRDNVTAALHEVKPGICAIVVVLDGHGGSDTSDQAQSVLQEITDRFAQKAETAAIEQLAKQVALEKRHEALKKRLDDAYELRGEFSKGAELLAEEMVAQKKVAVAEKMRELQGQLSSALTKECAEDIARLQQEREKIYSDHNMNNYGESGSSFDENVGWFESDWRNDLSLIEDEITRYNTEVLIPAMHAMKLGLSELQEKIAAARVSAVENRTSETEVVNSDNEGDQAA